jgi:hypothetical protein
MGVDTCCYRLSAFVIEPRSVGTRVAQYSTVIIRPVGPMSPYVFIPVRAGSVSVDVFGSVSVDVFDRGDAAAPNVYVLPSVAFWTRPVTGRLLVPRGFLDRLLCGFRD